MVLLMLYLFVGLLLGDNVIYELENVILAAQRTIVSGCHPPTTLKHNENVIHVEILP